MEHETLWSLLCDSNHWIFELILMVIFDGLIGVVLLPSFKRFVLHHRSDDKRTEDLENELAELKKRLDALDKKTS